MQGEASSWAGLHGGPRLRFRRFRARAKESLVRAFPQHAGSSHADPPMKTLLLASVLALTACHRASTTTTTTTSEPPKDKDAAVADLVSSASAREGEEDASTAHAMQLAGDTLDVAPLRARHHQQLHAPRRSPCFAAAPRGSWGSASVRHRCPCGPRRCRCCSSQTSAASTGSRIPRRTTATTA